MPLRPVERLTRAKSHPMKTVCFCCLFLSYLHFSSTTLDCCTKLIWMLVTISQQPLNHVLLHVLEKFPPCGCVHSISQQNQLPPLDCQWGEVGVKVGAHIHKAQGGRHQKGITDKQTNFPCIIVR